MTLRPWFRFPGGSRRTAARCLVASLLALPGAPLAGARAEGPSGPVDPDVTRSAPPGNVGPARPPSSLPAWPGPDQVPGEFPADVFHRHDLWWSRQQLTPRQAIRNHQQSIRWEALNPGANPHVGGGVPGATRRIADLLREIDRLRTLPPDAPPPYPLTPEEQFFLEEFIGPPASPPSGPVGPTAAPPGGASGETSTVTRPGPGGGAPEPGFLAGNRPPPPPEATPGNPGPQSPEAFEAWVKSQPWAQGDTPPPGPAAGGTGGLHEGTPADFPPGYEFIPVGEGGPPPGIAVTPHPEVPPAPGGGPPAVNPGAPPGEPVTNSATLSPLGAAAVLLDYLNRRDAGESSRDAARHTARDMVLLELLSAAGLGEALVIGQAAVGAGMAGAAVVEALVNQQIDSAGFNRLPPQYRGLNPPRPVPAHPGWPMPRTAPAGELTVVDGRGRVITRGPREVPAPLSVVYPQGTGAGTSHRGSGDGAAPARRTLHDLSHGGHHPVPAAPPRMPSHFPGVHLDGAENDLFGADPPGGLHDLGGFPDDEPGGDPLDDLPGMHVGGTYLDDQGHPHDDAPEETLPDPEGDDPGDVHSGNDYDVDDGGGDDY